MVRYSPRAHNAEIGVDIFSWTLFNQDLKLCTDETSFKKLKPAIEVKQPRIITTIEGRLNQKIPLKQETCSCNGYGTPASKLTITQCKKRRTHVDFCSLDNHLWECTNAEIGVGMAPSSSWCFQRKTSFFVLANFGLHFGKFWMAIWQILRRKAVT